MLLRKCQTPLFYLFLPFTSVVWEGHSHLCCSQHRPGISASFFLYLLLVERMIPWSSGIGWQHEELDVRVLLHLKHCHIQYVVIRQSHLIIELLMIWWCISQVIQAFLEAYQLTAISLPAICTSSASFDFLDFPIIDNFLWLDPSMFVIISKVSLSLHFAEPTGLSPLKQ